MELRTAYFDKSFATYKFDTSTYAKSDSKVYRDSRTGNLTVKENSNGKKNKK